MTRRDSVRTPLRVRLVLAPETAPAVAPIVHCPRERASVDASQCATCSARSMDLAEAAARRQLHHVVRPVTYCVRSATEVAEARRLLEERAVRALPVVDDELRVVGIVSRTELLISDDDAVVADVMTSRVHTIAEHETVGHAIALMAQENISEVPVVTEDGRLVGMWHALDALRWTAEQMGYTFVEPPESEARLRA